MHMNKLLIQLLIHRQVWINDFNVPYWASKHYFAIYNKGLVELYSLCEKRGNLCKMKDLHTDIIIKGKCFN